jgi:TPR repeat protein
MLGSLLDDGALLRRSPRSASAWLAKAAEQGHEEAMLALGTRYYLGRGGLEQDYARAAGWYEKCADAGDVGAQYLVASMYEHGLGVERDLERALQWYGAAARQGDVAAREQARAIAERLARERGGN